MAAGDGAPEYKAWHDMKVRCYLVKHPSFKNYGGRGIRVCDQWINSFETFLKDVGPRPSSDYSLERKENDGHYDPGNVGWATRSEQARNQRKRQSLQNFTTEELQQELLRRQKENHNAVDKPEQTRTANEGM